jgi:O-antigen biosynthesis protein WbqP
VRTGLYPALGKRLLDLVLASLGLVVLAPVVVLVALAVRIEDGGPSLFRQQRSGRHDQKFTLLKFRSMPVGSADLPSSAAHGLRPTRVGALIRRTNLDELPQLLNILAGDMSLVGPRPALPSQADLLALRRENGAISCRPGLTGLAQVSSYDGMPVLRKAEYDAEYAREMSFLLDCSIILQTFGYLIRRPPVY